MPEQFLFKHILSPRLVQIMGENIARVYPEFNVERFVEKIKPEIDALELKDRAKLIAKVMNYELPKPFSKAADVLVKSMQFKPTEAEVGKYPDFYFMPFSEFILAYGVDDFENGMRACYELTKVFTAEFCVRPFIQNNQKEALALLHEWAVGENQHVRRLVSEGTRPRLPWAGRLPEFQKDPKPVLELLEKLKADPELYVRRSVANNLNDIAKDHPDLVLETLQRWQKAQDKNVGWVIKHASRTLIKDGHTEALSLLGFNPNAQLKVIDLKCSSAVDFGNKLDFSFTIKNTGKTDENCVIDYVMNFKKANGKLAPKVFKLQTKTLKAGEELQIQKSHVIKPITTRVYYPGEQEISIQANGKILATSCYELVMP